METTLRAEIAGTVATVAVAAGAMVDAGAVAGRDHAARLRGFVRGPRLGSDRPPPRRPAFGVR